MRFTMLKIKNGGLFATARNPVLKTVGRGNSVGLDTSALRHRKESNGLI